MLRMNCWKCALSAIGAVAVCSLLVLVGCGGGSSSGRGTAHGSSSGGGTAAAPATNASTSTATLADQLSTQVATFVSGTSTTVQNANGFLAGRIAQSPYTALQDTVDFVNRSNAGVTAALSPDGSTIVLTSPDGLSSTLITDPTNSPDWTATYPTQRAGMSADGTVAARALQPLPQGQVKNNRVLLLFPFDGSFGQDALADQLAAQLKAACMDPTVIKGPIDVGTMLSFGQYGIVSIFTHGGIGKSISGDATYQTGLDSGMEATADNVQTVVAQLGGGADALRKIGLMKFGIVGRLFDQRTRIGYTSDFFASLDLSGTLLIVSACDSGNRIGANGKAINDLTSAVTASGGTIVAWRGLMQVALGQQALSELVGCLASGAGIDSCVQTVQSNERLGPKWSIRWILGYSEIQNMTDIGDGTLTAQVCPSPSPSPSATTTPTPEPGFAVSISSITDSIYATEDDTALGLGIQHRFKVQISGTASGPSGAILHIGTGSVVGALETDNGPFLSGDWTLQSVIGYTILATSSGTGQNFTYTLVSDFIPALGTVTADAFVTDADGVTQAHATLAQSF